VRPSLRYVAVLVIAVAAVLASAVSTAAAPRRDALRAALDKVVATGVPGTIAYARHGAATIWLARGEGNLAARTPIRRHDRFRIGSVTKTFLAAVVLQLVAEGKLALDDPVERFLPSVVPNGSAITIRQLLQHTAGLFDYANDGDTTILQPYLNGDFAYYWSPQQLLAVAFAHDPHFAPGTSWRYCNTCYIVLGLVVEAVTGHPVGAALRQRIFRPLGLAHTTFARKPEIAGRHTHGYILLDKPPLLDTSVFSPSSVWAAGAIVSTADDVARFYRALLRGRLLPPRLLAEMKTTVATGMGNRYGLGILTADLPCGAAWGHEGDFTGYETFALTSKDGRRQLVLLVNLDQEVGQSKKAQRAIVDALIAGYCG